VFPIFGDNVYTIEPDWDNSPWEPHQVPEMLEAEQKMLHDTSTKQQAEIKKRIAEGRGPGPEWKR